MNNRDRLTAFFAAENRRDWQAYAVFLSPDVVWTLHGAETKTIRGADAYMSVMQAAYADNADQFVCDMMEASADGRRLVTMLRNSRGERSCDIFEWEDGRLMEEHEFLLG